MSDDLASNSDDEKDINRARKLKEEEVRKLLESLKLNVISQGYIYYF